MGGEKRRRKLMWAMAVVAGTTILGLGLGLGLALRDCQNNTAPPVEVLDTSCRNRCYQPFDDKNAACSCDMQCGTNHNCCYDYHDICLQPTQQWECSKLRCGETRLIGSRCHCSDDCLASGDCCTNYKHVCHGETEWVEDKCADLSTPTCPAGYKQQPLLLVSLDGLRAEYQQTWSKLIPVLDKLSQWQLLPLLFV